MNTRLSLRLQRPRIQTLVIALAVATALGVAYCVKPSAHGADKAVALLAVDSSAPTQSDANSLPSPFPETNQQPKTFAHHATFISAAVAKPKPQKHQSAVRANQPTSPTFNGKKLVKVKTLRMLVTAYSPDRRSCGKWADGITASGYSVWTNGMKLVAADTRLLPFGTLVSIPGYNHGKPVPVLDRGGKIKGKHLDVLYPTHYIARHWGVKHLHVTIYKYAHHN